MGSRRLPDSPSRGVDFDYEYLHDFEAKIETTRKLVWGPMLTWIMQIMLVASFFFAGSSDTTCTSFKNSIADSPTHRYGESIFDYEYLHKFEAKIETARKLVWGTYADLNYAKTSENSVHCRVSLIKKERKKDSLVSQQQNGAWLMFIIIRVVQPIYIYIADKTSRIMYQNGLKLRGTAGTGPSGPT